MRHQPRSPGAQRPGPRNRELVLGGRALGGVSYFRFAGAFFRLLVLRLFGFDFLGLFLATVCGAAASGASTTLTRPLCIPKIGFARKRVGFTPGASLLKTLSARFKIAQHHGSSRVHQPIQLETTAIQSDGILPRNRSCVNLGRSVEPGWRLTPAKFALFSRESSFRYTQGSPIKTRRVSAPRNISIKDCFLP